MTVAETQELVTQSPPDPSADKLKRRASRVGRNTTPMKSLTSVLANFNKKAVQQLEGISTQQQLIEFCKKVCGELKNDIDNGIENAIASGISILQQPFQDNVDRQHNHLKMHFDALEKVIANTVALKRHALNNQLFNVQGAVNALGGILKIFIRKFDMITVMMKEIYSTVILDSLELFVTSQQKLSGEDIKENFKIVMEEYMDELDANEISDEKLQIVVDDAAASVEGADLDVVMHEVERNVEEFIAMHNNSIYGVEDIPMLAVISIPNETGDMIAYKHIFARQLMVKFLCPVCGCVAEAGSTGEGLDLCVPKKRLKELIDCFTIALQAIDVASKVSEMPNQRISAFMKSVLDAPSEEVQSLLTEATETLITFTRSNMLEYKLSGNQSFIDQRPSLSTEQTNKLRMLFAALAIQNFKDTGLRKVKCPMNESSAWLCSSVERQCSKIFMEQGNACLLVIPSPK